PLCRQVLQLRALRLTALSVLVGVLVPGPAVAAPAVGGVHVFRHGLLLSVELRGRPTPLLPTHTSSGGYKEADGRRDDHPGDRTVATARSSGQGDQPGGGLAAAPGTAEGRAERYLDGPPRPIPCSPTSPSGRGR